MPIKLEVLASFKKKKSGEALGGGDAKWSGTSFSTVTWSILDFQRGESRGIRLGFVN